MRISSFIKFYRTALMDERRELAMRWPWNE
jgi:hypothetical protein